MEFVLILKGPAGQRVECGNAPVRQPLEARMAEITKLPQGPGWELVIETRPKPEVVIPPVPAWIVGGVKR